MNETVVVLIPKVKDPKEVSDFRPISLPLSMQRSKSEMLRWVEHKVQQKLLAWNFLYLSKAGKEALIKSCVQAYPIYASHQQAFRAFSQHPGCSICHILREHNALADDLAKTASGRNGTGGGVIKGAREGMLACISCSKQVGEGEEEGEGPGGGNAGKEGVKSLTSQLKEMALKLKPTATSSTTYKRDHRQYPDFDIGSQRSTYPYNIPGSSSSTPAWDFPTTGRQPGASSSEANFTGRNENEKDGPKEWMAQVEPGVHITFMSLPNGGNDLKRIRFSREMFDKWQAQRWWGENYDRILELYNVQRFNRQALQTPARSEDERDSSYSRRDSVRESPMMTPASTRDWMPKHYYKPESGSKGYYPYPREHYDNQQGSSAVYGDHRGKKPSFDAASQATASERDETSVSMSNASEMDSEWVEEDEPGVYITIRQLMDGTKELRRVRFSRERFGEVNAKTWWEQNRERIQEQYL